jgi:hypothetical protein
MAEEQREQVQTVWCLLSVRIECCHFCPHLFDQCQLCLSLTLKRKGNTLWSSWDKLGCGCSNRIKNWDQRFHLPQTPSCLFSFLTYRSPFHYSYDIILGVAIAWNLLFALHLVSHPHLFLTAASFLKKSFFGVGGCSLMVEHMLSTHEALGSIPLEKSLYTIQALVHLLCLLVSSYSNGQHSQSSVSIHALTALCSQRPQEVPEECLMFCPYRLPIL